MKKMLFAGVVAVSFVAVVVDEVQLHRVVQRQNVAVERLTAEVEDLRRASVDREKKMTAARSLTLIPKVGNITTNGAATIFGFPRGKTVSPNQFQFENDLQESPSKVPSNWEPFEFNGRTYYRIPLASASPEPLGFSR